MKNANSFTSRCFSEAGWQPINDSSYDLSDRKIIVAYREPINRWLSGVTQYLYRNRFPNITINKTVVDILLDIVVVDNHTVPQTDYLHNVNTDNCLFFMVDENYTKNIIGFMGNQLNLQINYSSFWQNRTTENSDKLYIYNTVKKYMNKKLHRINAYYKNDLDLYRYILENKQ